MNKKNITDNSIFFEKIYKQPDFFNLKYSIPSVIISEDGNNHYIKTITSETDIDNFSFHIENKRLVINFRNDSGNEDELYLKSFEKIMEIPENSDINNIKSRLFNGVFTLIIPKSFCFYD